MAQYKFIIISIIKSLPSRIRMHVNFYVQSLRIGMWPFKKLQHINRTFVTGPTHGFRSTKQAMK